MTILDFNKSFYCPYVKNNQGDEIIYFYKDIIPDSTRKSLDLFESEEAMYRWIREEQKIQVKEERWSTFNIYDRFYPKKYSLLNWLN